MRRRFSAEQWSDWLDEFEHRGVSVQEFCRQKGVCQNSFYRWRKKLAADLNATQNNQPEFVPVTLAGSPLVEIELPGGAVMRVPNDEASLQPVLKALQAVGATR